MRFKTELFVGIALGLILILVFGSRFLNFNYQFHGSWIDPPIPAENFELTAQDGSTFRLSDQRGSLVLMFFGYTHCPDICPSTLAGYQKIQKGMAKKSEFVRFLFITIDPERDTPEQMASYIGFFDSSFIGLTADRIGLEPVWKAYGVYQEKQDAGSAAGYLVDHSTRIYVVDQKGNLVLTYPYGFDAGLIVDDLLYLLEGG